MNSARKAVGRCASCGDPASVCPGGTSRLVRCCDACTHWWPATDQPFEDTLRGFRRRGDAAAVERWDPDGAHRARAANRKA